MPPRALLSIALATAPTPVDAADFGVHRFLASGKGAFSADLHVKWLGVPALHSPWAQQLGLSERDLNETALHVGAARHERSHYHDFFGEGVIAARGHASGKGVPQPNVDRTANSLLDTYLATMLLMSAAVAFIYWEKGLGVVAGIISYLLALATMKIYVKWVYVVNDFQYPLFLTGAHMLASTLVGFAILLRRVLFFGESLVVPTGRELGFKFIPLAACIVISTGAGNSSLVFCSASFAEIVSATTPIVTVGTILVMGLPFHFRLLGPTLGVVLGCTLSVVGEVDFSLVGFVLCFVANIGRAMKVVLQQELMTGTTQAKFDPSATLAWMCACSFGIILGWSYISEGAAPYMRLLMEVGRKELVCSILVSCVNAVILHLAALHVTKHLGAVGAQLLSQVKAVLTVLGGMVVFHETLSAQEVVGFFFVLLGTYSYARIEMGIRRAAAAGRKGNTAPESAPPSRSRFSLMLRHSPVAFPPPPMDK